MEEQELTKLTEPQQRMLAEVREAGERRYNGRARRSVEALAKAGLVEYEYDQTAHAAIGSGIKITEVFIVRPSKVEGVYEALDRLAEHDPYTKYDPA